MSFGSYLMFNRNCEEALKIYEEAFGGKIQNMKKYSDMPPNPDFPIADEDKNLVLNATFLADGLEIMCADSPQRSTEGENMYITMTTKDEAAVKKAWDILAKEGHVYMELAPSFFATLHGSLRDRFGINWMFTAMR